MHAIFTILKRIIKKILAKLNTERNEIPKENRLYIIGEKSVLYDESDIVNPLNKKENIVIGHHTHIRGQLHLFGHGGNITIGNYCYVGHDTCIWSAKRITIGDRVLIAHNCNIFDNNTHPLDKDERHKQFCEIISTGFPRVQSGLFEEDIIIEDDAWISAYSIILKGIVIGEGAIVAAGSVVTKNVRPYTLVAGNPAKVIKKIK